LRKKIIVCAAILLHILILGRSGEAKPVFSLKSSVGYGIIRGGDLNSIFASHDGFYGDLAGRLGMEKRGRFEKMSGSADGKIAFFCDLSDAFGVGIGVGYVRCRKDSLVALSMAPLYQSETKMDGTLEAVPVELSAIYRLPLSKKWGLTVEAGLLYCFGTLSYAMSLEEEISTTKMTSQTQGAVDDRGLGFHGAAGLFYRLTRGIDIFIEGAARYARWNHWQGEESYSDTEKTYERRQGSLWYYEFYDGDAGKTYANLILSREKPSGAEIRNARLFDNSLSEISVRAGLRIML